MLGVRRPTVTLVMTTLTQLGIISTSRGVIRIISRDVLEAHACACYRTVKTLFDRVLPLDASNRLRTDDAWQEPAVLAT